MPITPKHLIAVLLIVPTLTLAQTRDKPDSALQPPQTPKITPATTQIKTPQPKKNYWRNLALGFGTSILAHEAGHLVAAYSVGATPRIGFDKWRPTVFSGIDANLERKKQFIFSSSGLTVQALLDEAILDIPHDSKGHAFERGILAGGIATAVFYATFGRNASNSDITFMARTSSLSKTEASLIYLGIAAMHTVRIARNDHYADFFIRPNPTSGLNIGISIQPLNTAQQIPRAQSLTASTSSRPPHQPQSIRRPSPQTPRD